VARTEKNLKMFFAVISIRQNVLRHSGGWLQIYGLPASAYWDYRYVSSQLAFMGSLI
jgi:hypothetical protein